MREKIISEIKRLSAKHGKTVGKRLFERETGISEGAYLGKYWAKWSDAVTEAGFEANKKNERSDADFLFGKFADICRHYQHIPSQGEFRMFRRTDPEVPTDTTFAKAFGIKSEMLRKLKAWVADKPEYGDIASMLAEVATEAEEEVWGDRPLKEGWVYVIQYGDHYKIGAGGDLEKRVKQVTTKLPDNGELIHAIRTDDPFGIENYWHRRFAEKRAKNNSEFFKLSVQDIRIMKKRKFM